MYSRRTVGNLTYNAAEGAYRAGLISDRDWRAFVLAWTWCGMRWGGQAGIKQERCYQRLGGEGLERRRARAKRLADAYFGS